MVQERKELFQRIKAQKIRVARIESHLETVAEVSSSTQHSVILQDPLSVLALCMPCATDLIFMFLFLQYEEWNKHSRKLLGYIQTRTKPPLFYLPAEHNSDTTELLKKTQTKIEGKERHQARLVHFRRVCVWVDCNVCCFPVQRL